MTAIPNYRNHEFKFPLPQVMSAKLHYGCKLQRNFPTIAKETTKFSLGTTDGLPRQDCRRSPEYLPSYPGDYDFLIAKSVHGEVNLLRKYHKQAKM